MRRLTALLTLSALAFTACGSDSDSGDGGASLSGADQALADALAADLRADEDGLAGVIDADCLAGGTVSALGGAERVAAEYGITVDNPDTDEVALSADDAAAVSAAYAGCGDLLAAFKVGFAQDGEVPDEVVECVLADITADDVKGVFEESLQGIDDGPVSERLFVSIFSRAEECGA